MRKIDLRAAAAATVFLSASLTVCAPAAEAQLTVLHQFTGGADGGTPYASLISDAAGNLYGTTYYGGDSNMGTAYKLSPPPTGGASWNEKVLHSFAGGLDGAEPNGGLVFDKAGNLYGMTSGGTIITVYKGGVNQYFGYDGTIFELTPPGAGKTTWGHSVLREFTPKDSRHGQFPLYCALILDARGTLYGVTSASNVFSLSPPAATGGTWQFKNLAFVHGGTAGSLTFDAHGALYGTTATGPSKNDGGIVYKLAPPSAGQTAWTEHTLATFESKTPLSFSESGVRFDAKGNIYGAGGNGVFMLSSPVAGQSEWKINTLHAFQGAFGNDKSDGFETIGQVSLGVALYGTTVLGGDPACPLVAPQADPNLGCGIIYRLTPPAAGKTAWTETVLYRFTGGDDGAFPHAGLLVKDGALYGTTSAGGQYGHGTVFKIIP